MKKNYLIALLVFAFQFASAQLEQTAYRGAFAPAPTAMWTDSWTNWDPKNTEYADAATVVNVTANITANTTWTTGKTYKLNGLIYVTNNATLTIQPGVIVKGIYSSTGTALVITKGAKLNAIGTAAAPIVFTSAKTVAQGRQSGDWGGVILLGKGSFNQNDGINNIEGITANANTEYGGGLTPDVNDNSGILKYVRIEFGGFVFSPNNEINGLTFGAVGAGTSIDYVQVSYSGDDSFEWFGGSVNCKHLVAYRGLDDDFDTDNGYSGVVQYGLAIRDPQIADNPAISTSEGFESDNNPNDVDPAAGFTNTTAIFSNCTLIGPSKRSSSVATGYQRALRLRRRTELKVINSVFLDFLHNYAGLTDDSTIGKAYAGKLKLNNNIFAGFYGADFTNFPTAISPVTKTATASNASLLGFASGTTWNLGTWMTAHGNSTYSSSDNILVQPYNTSDLSVYSGLDYRPGTVASTGASFSDSAILPYVIANNGSVPSVTTPVNYCSKAVSTQLTATMSTNGVSLKWYKSTTLTGATTLLTAAPTPATTAVGTQYYWVSEVNAANVESTKVLITVNVLALPTELIGSFSNVTNGDNTTAITTFAAGQFVGTSNQFTFSVPALVDTTLTYKWSVPNGVNIISGGNPTSRTITINFAGVAAGAGTIGSVTVQAQNANGCVAAAKSLSLTAALPAAPASIAMYDMAVSATAKLTAYSKYAGSTTPLTLTAAVSSTATSYSWKLPAGVNLILPPSNVETDLPSTVVTYYSLPLTGPGGVGNTSAGAHKWVVTTRNYLMDINGVQTNIKVSSAIQYIIGSGAYVQTSQPYLPYGTVIVTDRPSILVNFAGITDTATTSLYIGVKAQNGVGESVTNNATNVDVVANSTSIPGLFITNYSEAYTAPVPPSTNATSVYSVSGYSANTAKLLKLTAALPLAPATLIMTDPNAAVPTTAVTVVSKYIGTTKVLKLTAAASLAAASYTWELPSGATQLTGGNSNVITVDLAGVPAGTAYLYFGVKAHNFLGDSFTNNTALTPATTSTAKLLKVTATVPTAPAAVAGQTTLICRNAVINYTITASALANTYIITAPVNCIVTSSSFPSNTTNSLETADLVFTVTYPSNFAIVATGTNATSVPNKTITVFSKNGFGTSVAAKSLTLTSGNCNAFTDEVAVVSKSIATVETVSELYPNPTSEMFNVDVNAINATEVSVSIISMNGSLVSTNKIQLSQGSNTISQDVSTLSPGFYFVKISDSNSNDLTTKKFIKK